MKGARDGKTVEAVECEDRHVAEAKGDQSTTASIKATCVECHDGDETYGDMLDEWKEQASALDVRGLNADLAETRRMIPVAIRNGIHK